MNLNSYILLDYLPKDSYYKITNSFSQFPFSYISFYEEGISVKEGGAVLLAKAEKMKEIPPCSSENPYLLISSGMLNSVPEDFKGDIICCDEIYELSEIFEMVSYAFRELSVWEKQLTDSIIHRRSLSWICKVSTGIFKNSILIHGSDYSILAEAENEDYSFQNSYAQEDMNYISEEIVSDLELSPGFVETFQSRKPEFFVREGVSCIYSNVFIKEEFAARITIEGEEKNITEGKRSLTLFFTEIVKNCLTASSYSIYNHLHSFKRHLTYFIENEEEEEKKYLAATLDKIHWKEQEAYYCVILEPDKLTHGPSDRNYDCLMLEKKFKGIIVVPIEKCLLMVCNLRVCGYTKEKLRSHLSVIIRERLMKAGYCTVFHDFYDLPAYYQQAKAALETGKRYDFMLWQYDFEDYRLKFVLDYGLRALPAKVLYPEGIHQIMDYDKKYHSNYYETLKTYIENDLSAAKTSKALYIHISTFRYRMERILELLQLDIKNPDIRLYLMLIFKL